MTSKAYNVAVKTLVDPNATVNDLRVAGKDILKELNEALKRENKLLIDHGLLLEKYHMLLKQALNATESEEEHNEEVHTDNK